MPCPAPHGAGPTSFGAVLVDERLITLGPNAFALLRTLANTDGVARRADLQRCLPDGTDEHAAALVADRLCYRASGWWRAGATSADPARAAAADRIDLAAGLPLALTDDEGKGAAATLALLQLVVDRST